MHSYCSYCIYYFTFFSLSSPHSLIFSFYSHLSLFYLWSFSPASPTRLVQKEEDMTSWPERWHLGPGESEPWRSSLLPGPPLRSRTPSDVVGFGGPCLHHRGLTFFFCLDFLWSLGIVKKEEGLRRWESRSSKKWVRKRGWWWLMIDFLFWIFFFWSVLDFLFDPWVLGWWWVDDGGWMGWWWWLGGCGLIWRWIFYLNKYVW